VIAGLLTAAFVGLAGRVLAQGPDDSILKPPQAPSAD
jgi:hypothetical protein